MAKTVKISWNEVRDRALRFSHEWAGATREASEKQTFWNEFFLVFGIPRPSVASFEEPVENVRGKYGFIDLFWPKVVLVEHKSRGADLAKATTQAKQYIQDLQRSGEDEKIPRYLIVSDFDRIALYDLMDAASSEPLTFNLKDLSKHVRAFAFLKGETAIKLDPEDPANEKACQVMADLHDELKAGGFDGPDLERFLVRILFCLFAEDTGIFEQPAIFTNFIKHKTRDDGSDLGAQLNLLFEILNTPEDKRQRKLDESLAEFPYVNGHLFAERLGFADFNRQMRESLVRCCNFQWAAISPAVFGSLFQGIMEPKERRQIGAHYTSERDIMKVIRALFLDDLKEELAHIMTYKPRQRPAGLKAFQQKLRSLRFLDPACGCGNFLILTYRELRRLELEILKNLYRQTALDIKTLSVVDVDQFYGIELFEWPVRIAEVGLWLMDHQMNREVAEAMGQSFVRLPLTSSPTIVNGNALHIDWRTILSPDDNVFVLGNPPFVGKKEQDSSQKKDMELVWGDTKGTGVLDYVTCWYRKAAEYIAGTKIRCAFVSTNSISQGEQVGVLWSELFGRWHIKMHFAHRTFAWQSESRGRAHVHVVIIGFGTEDYSPKRIFDYQNPNVDPTVTSVSNINPYLLEGTDTVVRSRTAPINGAFPINYGSMMIDKDRTSGDDCGLILTPEHREILLIETPALAPYIRRLYGGDEFINGTERWCLWLVDAPPQLVRSSSLLRQRIETVRKFRMKSNREQTKALAAKPALFGEIRQPITPYLLIPKVSSETRQYIPIGFLTPDIIASGSALIVPDATLYHFGVLSSAMHNAWMRTVAGRMESRYQYSGNIVYNNFPWPSGDIESQKKAIEAAAQGVIDARQMFPGASLGDLYDPHAMPADLMVAHTALDRAVDRAYRKEKFQSDRERVECLFKLYESLNQPIIAASSGRKNSKSAGRRKNQEPKLVSDPT